MDQAYWDNIYHTKDETDFSWYQSYPHKDVERILSLPLSKDAPILDVGGGDSFLSGALLEKGYTHLSVLDISAQAIERARTKLGSAAASIQWIVQDITRFSSDNRFDLWYDRAAFHFLTRPAQVAAYAATTAQHINNGGYLIIGTFSVNGPARCSGLPVQQYSATTLNEVFRQQFELLDSTEEIHTTPTGAQQQFLFGRFRKK